MVLLETAVPVWSVIPFVVMLLCIAILPLIPATAKLWDDWRFQLTVALVLGVPVTIWLMVTVAPITVVHTALEYFQFIALLFALYVVSGGIYLDGDIRPTPRNNTIILAIGAVLASFIGTTGAAMLLIRPLLNINAKRQYKVHTVIFTILIAANCGGLLTPLGDPPLFMGFLRGVPFTWTFHLIPEWLFINGLLLLMYLAIDTAQYAKEEVTEELKNYRKIRPVRIDGAHNLIFLVMIIVAVALIPSINLEAIEAGTAAWYQWVPWRELVFALACIGSLVIGDKDVRWKLNEYSWAPIREVAVIFVGIFLTMQPALRYVAQIAPSLPLTAISFYGFSAGLSAFLDNAPTYVTFFEMAAQLPAANPVAATGVDFTFLRAISLGAVTGGAMTYIGNGPNFMVKSVAESHGVKMPSFGHYMGWTLTHLLPVLIAMAMIFIAGGIWLWIGLGLAIVILAACAWLFFANLGKANQVNKLVGSNVK